MSPDSCDKSHQFENEKYKVNETQEKTLNIQDEKRIKKLKRYLSRDTFKSKSNISKDLENSEDSSNSSSSSDSEESHLPKLKYKCSFENCNQYFRREKDLDKHEFRHNGVAKYTCNFPDCTKQYRLRAHLKRHILTFHEKKKNEVQLKCDIENCNRQFSSKFSLNRHVREFHEKLRKFPCTECDRVYERKNHLKLHLITHTKKYPFKCYKCDKGFVSETIFKRHNCSELHTCDSCDQKFGKWSELVKHRRTEHQPFSYNCNECNEIFESKQKLKLHKRIHKDKHNCPWEGCENSYLDRRNLKNHINIKHLGQKYKCTIEGCDKELSSKSKLDYHLRLHEKPSAIIVKDTKMKIRKKRKDAGITKKSVIGLLANIVVKPEVERILRDENYDVTFENLSSDHETSETDGENHQQKSSPVQFELQIKSI